MPDERTHASWFSGVGGLDMGLERAGWQTVSFSEIDPYASAVLAERWPGIPNVGDIVQVARVEPDVRSGSGGSVDGGDWRRSTLWTGGFPCQDLSVAGKRRGFGAVVQRERHGRAAGGNGTTVGLGESAAGASDHGDAGEPTRSGLAFAFLDLVERHRPPAILLENVPGLLSSHGGRDMAVLTGRMAELGYGVAYRILDARHFGVPQRRRRVFILGLRSAPDDPSGRAAAERAAAVLAVGTRCDRHPATGGEAGPGAAERVGVGVSHALAAHHTTGRLDSNGETFVGPQIDSRGVRAPDGLAGRTHDRLMGPLREHVRPGSNTDYTVVQSLDTKRGGPDDNEAQAGHLVAFVKQGREHHDDGETWGPGEVSPVVDSIGHGPRTAMAVLGSDAADDPLLPLGLNSHRYRCCGNGVVANVAEWLGVRLLSTGTVPE